MAAGESDVDARIPVILRIKRRRHGDASDALGMFNIHQAICFGSSNLFLIP